MADHLSRRTFLKQSTAVAGALSTGPFLLAAGGSPNEKLGVAVIGCGGMGGGNPGVAANERCVALCDIDDKPIAKAKESIAKKVPDPTVFHDYRKMYDAVHKDIDVVLIATPDHHHGPAGIRALQLGKHAFIQKPLAHNIYECRALAEAARKAKVHTQMGNQGHCGEGYRRLCEYIWSGAIGNVLETHSILGRDFGGRGGIPKGKPTPEGLRWDEWLGPAPMREFHDGLHPFGWRSWRQFGTGTLGDMACHVMDGVFWALKIGDAKTWSVECVAQKPGSAEMFPQSNVLRFDIPARGDMPAVKCYTYDNKNQKPQFIKDLETKNERKFDDGTIYVGEKGIMFTGTYGDNVRIIPEEQHKATPAPAQSIPRVKGGPIGDLFQAIKGGPTAPCSNFIDSAGPFTEFILTGQLAMYAGPARKFDWDVAAMKTSDAELNRFVKREHRKGWEV